MIFGIGIDIVEISRLQAELDELAQRILTETEAKQYKESSSQQHFLAKRLAIKEAFSKAIGTGMRNPVTFKNITVTHTPTGKPIILLSRELQSLVNKHDIVNIHVTVSDEQQYAVASVILER